MNLTQRPIMQKTAAPAPRGRRKRADHTDAIRDAARGETCTLRLPCCNGDPSTTVLAHLRVFGIAGMGEKPSDAAAVMACGACHDALDRRDGATAGLWGFEDLLRALLETHRRLVAKGLLHLGRVE